MCVCVVVVMRSFFKDPCQTVRPHLITWPPSLTAWCHHHQCLAHTHAHPPQAPPNDVLVLLYDILFPGAARLSDIPEQDRLAQLGALAFDSWQLT